MVVKIVMILSILLNQIKDLVVSLVVGREVEVVNQVQGVEERQWICKIEVEAEVEEMQISNHQMPLMEAIQTIKNTKSGINLAKKKKVRRQMAKKLSNEALAVKANSLKLHKEKARKMPKTMERKIKMATETLKARLSNN